jgi:glycolate oxidase
MNNYFKRMANLLIFVKTTLMNFNKITPDHLDYFKSVLDEKSVHFDADSLQNYSRDETEDLVYLPEVVIKPSATEEVSKVLAYCNSNNISVTPCGARTGLSGGSLPVCGGVALSMERFNTIIEIDERNLQATVEPGVINQVFKDAVKEKGLFYPPDPASKGSSFLGGNLAENSGGPKALKYGVTKDYVLNLEVVLPSGDIIWTGANVLKNSTGYNLTQLMIGSEGTLGVITKIVFKLIPHPTQDLTLLVPFRSAEKACEAVSAVFRAGITPSALEFMEREALDWTLKFSDVNISIEDDVEAHLLVEVDGNDMDTLFKDCERITEVMEQFDCGEILFADSSLQKEQLWKMRRAVGEACKE